MYIILKSDLTPELIDGVLRRYLKGKVRSHKGKTKLSPWDIRRIETFMPILTGKDWNMKEELIGICSLWLVENIHLLEMNKKIVQNKDGKNVEFKSIEFIRDSYFQMVRVLDNFIGDKANEEYERKDVIRYKEDGTKYRTTEYHPRKLYYDDGSESTLMALDSKALKDYLIQDTGDYSTEFNMLVDAYLDSYVSKGGDEIKAKIFKEVEIYGNDIQLVADALKKSKATIYRWIALVKKVVVDMIKQDQAERAKEKSWGYNTNVSDTSFCYSKPYIMPNNHSCDIMESDVACYSVVDNEQWKVNTTPEDCVEIPYFDFSVYDGWIIPEVPKYQKGEMTVPKALTFRYTGNYKPIDKNSNCGIHGYYIPAINNYREGVYVSVQSKVNGIKVSHGGINPDTRLNYK